MGADKQITNEEIIEESHSEEYEMTNFFFLGGGGLQLLSVSMVNFCKLLYLHKYQDFSSTIC